MAEKMRIVVIGGSAAGPKAAARARRMDEQAAITIIQKDPDLSMASCGYPYYIGGLFDERSNLISTSLGVIRDPDYFMKTKGITALTLTEAVAIDRNGGLVSCRDLRDGREFTVPYDRLVIATGAAPRVPPLPGVELEGITTLHSLKDTDYLRGLGDDGASSSAVVIGGGLVGIEACEALVLSEIKVTLVEMAPQILPFLDPELAMLAENYCRARGIEVFTERSAARFIGEGGHVTGLELDNGTVIPCDCAIIAIGVTPNVSLARNAGLAIGPAGGITVDRFMQTSDPRIYAAGDCVEVPHFLRGTTVHAPFGDMANIEGRVAGENAACGNRAEFYGTIGTGICKIFDYAAGITGLSEKAARAAGFSDIVTSISAGGDKPFFMNAKSVITKVAADNRTGRIIGVQCVGDGDIAKELSLWSTAIKGGLTIDDMTGADLPYAPPFSPALGMSVIAAEVTQNKRRGLFTGIAAAEVKNRIDAGERLFMLDVRSAGEFRDLRLGIGEVLIPLDELRRRIDEIPSDRDAEIICYCKVAQRGYEASRILRGMGWTTVKVMEGGINAWPYGYIEKGGTAPVT